MSRSRDGIAVPLTEEGDTVLFAERLRDGRVALGTRTLKGGDWAPSELHVLGRPAILELAGWLGEIVEDAWAEAARQRQPDTLRTATDLYGDAPDRAERLALEMIRHVPAPLLRRAFLLLVNSVGPEAHARLVERLNRTADVSEDAQLRRQLADAREAAAYALAAAALFDAIDTGLAGPGAHADAAAP